MKVFSRIFSSLVGHNYLCRARVSSWNIWGKRVQWLVLFIVENPCSRRIYIYLLGLTISPSSPISSGGGEAATIAGSCQVHIKTSAKKLWEKRAPWSPPRSSTDSKTEEAMWTHRSSADFTGCSCAGGRSDRCVCQLRYAGTHTQCIPFI